MATLTEPYIEEPYWSPCIPLDSGLYWLCWDDETTAHLAHVSHALGAVTILPADDAFEVETYTFDEVASESASFYSAPPTPPAV